MKKILALVLAALMLCSFASALAETPGMPKIDSFASMKTETKGDVIYVKLSKPVDKLYANWCAELRIVPLAVSEDLWATVITTGHNYQIGVSKVNTVSYGGRKLGCGGIRHPMPKDYAKNEPQRIRINEKPETKVDMFGNVIKPKCPIFPQPMVPIQLTSASDRAFVTLQGNWIVSYSRSGVIVDITYTETGDIQDIRDVAFLNFSR